MARVGGWIPATSGLLTSAAVLLLILTGHIEEVTPVAVLGAAVTGGTAITINVRVDR
jgi:hypothetical protein